MYVSHVANSWEDHKASQDTCEWVGKWYNQSVSGKEGGQNKQFQYSSSTQETQEN